MKPFPYLINTVQLLKQHRKTIWMLLLKVAFGGPTTISCTAYQWTDLYFSVFSRHTLRQRGKYDKMRKYFETDFHLISVNHIGSSV